MPRRDPHDRGMRGRLAPAHLPLAKSRADAFDDLVLDVVEQLERRWAEQLRGVEFAVEEVPPPGEEWPAGSRDGPVWLSRLIPAAGNRPARIVIYRRPLELRAFDRLDLADLVHDVVIEEVADYLDVDPDTLDPPPA